MVILEVLNLHYFLAVLGNVDHIVYLVIKTRLSGYHVFYLLFYVANLLRVNLVEGLATHVIGIVIE